jgi:iron-sulfur cluster insertion protein
MTQEGIVGSRLRIMVRGGGCSGFAYDIAFDEKQVDGKAAPAMADDPINEERDLLFSQFGVTIISDRKSLEHLNGTEIDYVETLQRSGFKFNNPNVTSTCGCGESFS